MSDTFDKIKKDFHAALSMDPAATSRVEVVSDVMSHVAAVSCIHDPTFDATVAVQRMRKIGTRSGPQAEGLRASGSAAAVPVMPNDNRPRLP